MAPANGQAGVLANQPAASGVQVGNGNTGSNNGGFQNIWLAPAPHNGLSSSQIAATNNPNPGANTGANSGANFVVHGQWRFRIQQWG